MQLPPSPRLPGVPILRLDATGPEYSRWRRSLKFALETRDTWKYCNGTFPMPMPKERPALARFEDEIDDTQPRLLDERRAWMRQDREVKLDIFLSLAEEVMLDVFELGHLLPPTKCNAQEMLEVLDRRFSVFEFEGYHHAFCHFLNLRVDQCASLDEFNKEFLTVLEDLHDYGQPLSNIQACSAYFSKLNCTQNPWVAKKVEEWDTQTSEPQIHDILQESVLWPYVKPLRSKLSQDCSVKPESEDHFDDDAGPGVSDVPTLSSKTSHSRQLSTTSSEQQRSTSQRLNKQRFDPQALREALEKIPAIFDPESSSLHEVAGTTCTTPEWLRVKEEIVLQSEPQLEPMPATADIPSLSLPPAALHKSDSKSHMRSRSAPILSTTPRKAPVPERNPRRPQTTYHTVRQPTPPLTEHPAFRNRAYAPPEDLTVEIHPALRPMPPVLQPQKSSSVLRSQSSLARASSQRLPPKQTSHRPRAHSVGNPIARPGPVPKDVPRSPYDRPLPPSPPLSSSSSIKSTTSNTPLVLSMQVTDTTLPYISPPSSSTPSPIAIAIPVSLFSRSSFQGDKKQDIGNIQAPVSVFSLAPTTTSSLSILPSPPPPPPPQAPFKHSKAVHKGFRNRRESGRGKGKDKEREKSWGLGMSRMARLGVCSGEEA